MPFCPFVRSYIEHHPEYLDLVPPERRAGFGLPVMADVVKRAPFCDGAGDCRGWHDRVAELDGSQREQKPFTKK